MAMICSSENLLLRIVRLLSGGYGLYPNLEKIAGLRSNTLRGFHFETNELAIHAAGDIGRTSRAKTHEPSSVGRSAPLLLRKKK
jgi:hypothetical protein